MTIVERLDQDLKESLRARDALRTSTIRLVRAAIKNLEIEQRRPLSDDDAMRVVQHEVKRRREAIEGFQRGGRDDLVQKEQLELAILLGYVPAPLDDAALRKVIADVKTEVGATTEREFGKVMGAVMRRVAGRADGKVVEGLVREALRG
jgi:uncharacterized protein YqeY